MKFKRSKLLSNEEESVWLVAGLRLNLGNNPSTNRLYSAIAAELYDELYNHTDLQDTVLIRWEHNFSHMIGKCQSWFSVSGLSDYMRDLEWDDDAQAYRY